MIAGRVRAQFHQPQGAVVGGLNLSAEKVGSCEVVQDVRIIRCQIMGRAQQLDGLRVLTGLLSDQAQQVERLRAVRIGPDHRLEARRRVGHLPDAIVVQTTVA